MSLQERYLEFLKQVQQISLQCGRNPKDVQVISVSKMRSLDQIVSLYEVGCKDFGENRVDEALEKIEHGPQGISWHFIGTLQSKKVNKTIGRFCLIHSVDSLKLAQKLSLAGEKEGKTTQVLLQANTSEEETKHGYSPREWRECIHDVIELPNLRVLGFMTMAPYTPDQNQIRSCFRNLANLRKELEDFTGCSFPHLSMGMSNDWQIGIEEGATLLRVGGAIFGV